MIRAIQHVGNVAVLEIEQAPNHKQVKPIREIGLVADIAKAYRYDYDHPEQMQGFVVQFLQGNKFPGLLQAMEDWGREGRLSLQLPDGTEIHGEVWRGMDRVCLRSPYAVAPAIPRRPSLGGDRGSFQFAMSLGNLGSQSIMATDRVHIVVVPLKDLIDDKCVVHIGGFIDAIAKTVSDLGTVDRADNVIWLFSRDDLVEMSGNITTMCVPGEPFVDTPSLLLGEIVKMMDDPRKWGIFKMYTGKCNSRWLMGTMFGHDLTAPHVKGVDHIRIDCLSDILFAKAIDTSAPADVNVILHKKYVNIENIGHVKGQVKLLVVTKDEEDWDEIGTKYTDAEICELGEPIERIYTDTIRSIEELHTGNAGPAGEILGIITTTSIEDLEKQYGMLGLPIASSVEELIACKLNAAKRTGPSGFQAQSRRGCHTHSRMVSTAGGVSS
jgi:hypothetical protein